MSAAEHGPMRRAIAALVHAIDRLAVVAGYLAALCLGALVVMITAQIVLASASRIFPDLPGGIRVAWEYSAYLMGTAFMLGSAMTLRAGAHIRLGTLIDNVSPRVAWVLELFASAIGSAFTAFLFWSLLRFTMTSASRGQLSAESFTPLWIPEAALTAGAFLLCLQMLARLLAAAFGMPVTDPALRATTVEDLPEPDGPEAGRAAS